MNLPMSPGMIERKKTVSQIPYISYYSIYKATAFLKPFSKIYCPIYNICDDEFFVYYPLLLFIEAVIYEADMEVESNQKDGSLLTQTSPWDSRKRIIQSFLKEHNLEHNTIVNKLEKVTEFVKLENKLVTSEKVTHEDVIRASELRSCDFRVVHSALVQISGKPYRSEIFDLMEPREVLIEFNDDLISYKKDMAASNYNTYWMFQKLYGEEAHHYLKAEIDRYKNLFEEKLKRFPQEEQEIYLVTWSRFWQRFPYLSDAELIRQVALEGIEKTHD
ncbi:MAG: hypothetical protein EWV58_08480 [Microcystis aeruginosa Ma_MB_F_20061100_S19]|uniref:Uncharacterized protein n=1 Tax=Microcystis aeruginosa SPC777 TaxID=482300 RepID=S3JCI0_MICAE|nr:hypothetical protein [Microcystis aeruginosa]NCR97017.1 hypothetical protein [Microcystis aeruginosa L311-01]OCY13569.1 MAG: hypothetical protein BEV12_22890 [Microcystis aeruginosa CACIAM 03]TRU05637.1 MAG: hypothetical protein EWV59_21470 [Microcystis aeruginosa Ma_MB_F_20061100_S19D]TRU16026.1 MAG: hypothetical protein EWV58_08480 [Microcystis aeruginosa Ma_MB_F_20061100_S19]EPF22840.1 hypothetical protein MAESPC_01419 [Microcystis aeruginosa SPC777]